MHSYSQAPHLSQCRVVSLDEIRKLPSDISSNIRHGTSGRYANTTTTTITITMTANTAITTNTVLDTIVVSSPLGWSVALRLDLSSLRPNTIVRQLAMSASVTSVGWSCLDVANMGSVDISHSVLHRSLRSSLPRFLVEISA